MKRIIPFLVLFLTFSMLKAQSVREIFDELAVVYYGIDYGHAKFTGVFDQYVRDGKDENQVKSKFFTDCNEVVLLEKSKYNISKNFQKPSVIYHLDMINKKNLESVTTNNVLPKRLDSEKIQHIVNTYDTGEDTGLGLVFITDEYNKYERIGAYYVTFFDISSKKVLLTEKVTAEPGGFGLRNFWISSFKQILTKCHWRYRTWKKSLK